LFSSKKQSRSPSLSSYFRCKFFTFCFLPKNSLRALLFLLIFDVNFLLFVFFQKTVSEPFSFFMYFRCKFFTLQIYILKEGIRILTSFNKYSQPICKYQLYPKPLSTFANTPIHPMLRPTHPSTDSATYPSHPPTHSATNF
jgi:hypothetical protein